MATHTETLKDWKQKERIRYIGITHYTSSAYGEVERWLKTKQYDFLQINYSLGEREVREPASSHGPRPECGRDRQPPLRRRRAVQKTKDKPLPPWAAELGIGSWAQYFLKWIVSHPAVTCAIPGTGNPKHMADNLGAGAGQLPNAARAGTDDRILRCTRLRSATTGGRLRRRAVEALHHLIVTERLEPMGRSTSRNLANRRRKQKIKKQLARQGRLQKKAKR